jgi:tRNA modification GTPase
LPRLHVYNKLDTCDAARAGQLAADHAALAAAAPGAPGAPGAGAADGGDPATPPAPLLISARAGAGLPALRASLLQLAGWQAGNEGVFIARARHVAALHTTGHHLASATALIDSSDPALELLAEELRLAHDALGLITGTCTPDELLGEIFGRFCIGK